MLTKLALVRRWPCWTHFNCYGHFVQGPCEHVVWCEEKEVDKDSGRSSLHPPHSWSLQFMYVWLEFCAYGWAISSVTQSCLTLWPNGLHYARPPCPSPILRVYSNSYPLNQWCYPTISPFVVPFSSYLQSFPASVLFKWVGSLHQVAKVLEFQLLISL